MNQLEQNQYNRILKATLNATENGIIVIDDSGSIRFSNPQFNSLWGYKGDELEGQNFETVIEIMADHSAEPDSFIDKIKDIQGDDNVFFDTLILKDDYIYEVYSSPIKTEETHIGRIWSFNDITARKQLEKDMWASRARFQDIARMSGDIIWEVDEFFKFTFISGQPWELLGFEVEDLKSMNFYDLILNKDQTIDFLEIIFLNRQPLVDYEFQCVTNNDGEVWLQVNCTVVYDDEEKYRGYRGIFKDITKRKRAQEVLKQKSQEWETTFNSIEDFIAILDLEGRVIRANKSLSDELKKPQEDLQGMICGDIYQQQGDDNEECPVSLMLKTKSRIEKEVFDQGLGLHLLISISPIFDKNNELIGGVHVARDISERKAAEIIEQQMQAKLVANSKLATLGEVSTGVAHEINQPLTYISSFLQNLELAVNKGTVNTEKTLERLSESRRQVMRIRDIVQHLRTFGRKDELVFKPVRIEEVFKNSLLLMGERIRLRNVLLEQRISENLPEIRGNANQLEQVFINLFQNAMDALFERDDAKITVVIDLDKSTNSVRISMEDNGVGMPDHLIQKIFEPFFTTKEVGKGTGLGLSIVYGIINDHGGTISCESVQNFGTKFLIKFPVGGEGSE